MIKSKLIQKKLSLIGGLIFIALLISFFAPIIKSFSFTKAFDFSQNCLNQTSGETNRLYQALKFTILQAFFSTLFALLLALPTSYFTAKKNFALRRLILSLSGIPLSIPPIIIALAFVLFYGRNGVLNNFLTNIFNLEKPPVNFLYSFYGIIIAHGFYNFPIIMRSVHQIWEKLNQETEDAACLLGASKARIFFTITLPSLSGAIVSSSMLVFLYCFFSFPIILLFGTIGTTSLEVELYKTTRSLLNFQLAGKIALLETTIAILITVIYAYTLNKLSNTRSKLKNARTRHKISTSIEKRAFYIIISIILIFFIGPLVSIIFKAFDHKGWQSLFSRKGFFQSLINSCITGILVAIIVSTAALFLTIIEAVFFRKNKTLETKKHKLAQLFFTSLAILPLAISSVMLGFGWTLLVPRGNFFVLVLAQSTVAFPIVYSQIKNSLDAIPQSIIEASSIISRGKTDQAFRLYIPLLSKGIFSGAAFAFAYSIGDASLPLVLSLGKLEPLALRLFRLAGSYRITEACACAVIIGIFSSLAFIAQDLEGKTFKPFLHPNRKGKNNG